VERDWEDNFYISIRLANKLKKNAVTEILFVTAIVNILKVYNTIN